MRSDIALDSEQVIRRADKVAEDKDIDGWMAAFTEDGVLTDQSIGDVRFGTLGEWAAPRMRTVQFRDIHGNDVAEFGRPEARVVVSPASFAGGHLIYPYRAATTPSSS